MRLVTFATRQFKPRQKVLSFSAKSRASISAIDEWDPGRLAASNFPKLCPDLNLRERGAGFWSWKPFVILEGLRAAPADGLVLYCDVGRIYPWKLIDRNLDPLVSALRDSPLDVVPGVEIPWHGSLKNWTKQDAYILGGFDSPPYRDAGVVQASFSLWKKSDSSMALAAEWFELCRKRALVSDDPSECGKPEDPDFIEHRHDQSLWSLLCVKHGLKALSVGSGKPSFDERNPARVCDFLDGGCGKSPFLLRSVVTAASTIEKLLRPA